MKTKTPDTATNSPGPLSNRRDANKTLQMYKNNRKANARPNMNEMFDMMKQQLNEGTKAAEAHLELARAMSARAKVFANKIWDYELSVTGRTRSGRVIVPQDLLKCNFLN